MQAVGAVCDERFAKKSRSMIDLSAKHVFVMFPISRRSMKCNDVHHHTLIDVGDANWRYKGN